MTIERESVLNKIRALLAKTMENGCSEAEAMAALGKAQAMRDAYAVTEAELNLTKEEKAILRREPPGTKDPHRIKWFLVGAVSKFCSCRCWRQRRDEGGGLVFCGLPADAQFATWLLDTLAAFVQGELYNFLMEDEPSNEERREAIRGFVFGCCERISDRLSELCQQSTTLATSNAKALVVVKDAAIQAKLDELGISLCSGSVSCGAWDYSSYQAGKAAGDRASFGRPVSGRNATLRIGN
jgi:Protein of unknown function (DUF2786)